MRFQEHPTLKELGEALGGGYHKGRRLVNSGVVEAIYYPGGRRARREDANQIIAEGLTPEQRELYSKYVEDESKGRAA